MKKLVAPIDYSLYAGRWIALVRDQVAGVGRTAEKRVCGQRLRAQGRSAGGVCAEELSQGR